MLFRDEIIDSESSIWVDWTDLGFDVPKDLALGVRTLCKLEDFLKSRYFGSRVCQLHGLIRVNKTIIQAKDALTKINKTLRSAVQGLNLC